ncbi:MAG: hypothetical protein ABH868_03730 [bacterium]
MNSLHALEKEFDKAIVVIKRLKAQKRELSGRIRELEVSLKEVSQLRSQNSAWQKDKNVIKLKIEKILKNLEVFK